MGRVTSNDVARLAGVSRTTVSLVLNEVENARISEATKKKVREAAEQLNYRPNALAQSLKTNRSKVIGLIIPSITNPFFLRLLREWKMLLFLMGIMFSYVILSVNRIRRIIISKPLPQNR